MSSSMNDDSIPLGFVDDLDNGQSLLYVQGRLLLRRICRVLNSSAQLRDDLSSDSPASSQETEQSKQLANLMLAVRDSQDTGGACSADSLRGIRLLHRLSRQCAGPEPGALLCCLRTAVLDIGAGGVGQRFWKACLRFADADASYGQLQNEILGAQFFYPRESRLIQRALILLDSVLVRDVPSYAGK